MTVLTPQQVADRWKCSQRHVRDMVDKGQLRAFRLGGRLLRISEDAVREVECQTTSSAGSGADGTSPGGETGNVTDIHWVVLNRAKRRALRRRSTQS